MSRIKLVVDLKIALHVNCECTTYLKPVLGHSSTHNKLDTVLYTIARKRRTKLNWR